MDKNKPSQTMLHTPFIIKEEYILYLVSRMMWVVPSELNIEVSFTAQNRSIGKIIILNFDRRKYKLSMLLGLFQVRTTGFLTN